jgi:hypothetical protein
MATGGEDEVVQCLERGDERKLMCRSELWMLLQGPRPNDGLDGDDHNITFPLCCSTRMSSSLVVPHGHNHLLEHVESHCGTVTDNTSSNLDAKPHGGGGLARSEL